MRPTASRPPRYRAIARTLDAIDDRITLSIGACGVAFGPGTIAAICKSAADQATNDIMALMIGSSNSGGTGCRFRVLGTTQLADLKLGGSSASAPTIKLLTAEGWCLLAVTKATGTVAPRFHKYVFSTNTWTHENSSTSIANNSAPSTTVTIGANVAAQDFFGGDIAIEGFWNVVLADAQIESLAYNLNAWWAPAQPKGLWLLDQAATTQKVVDLSGGGANESAITGTAVGTSSVPVFGYGGLVQRVQRIMTVPALPFYQYFARQAVQRASSW